MTIRPGGAAALSIVACTLALHGSPAAAQASPRFPLPPATWPAPVHDRPAFLLLLLDRLEYGSRDGRDAWSWDAQAAYGGDYHKLWLKAEGEREVNGPTEDASVEALYARRFAPFWFFQAGVRASDRPGPRRNAFAVGIQGLAPYWFDVETFIYAYGNGAFEARVEAENDVYLTQRLILQPRLEARAASRSNPERAAGSGLVDMELGLRLRYEVKREMAPYVGVTWTRLFGDTADIARRVGESRSTTTFVAGIRLWY